MKGGFLCGCLKKKEFQAEGRVIAKSLKGTLCLECSRNNEGVVGLEWRERRGRVRGNKVRVVGEVEE